IDVNEQALKEYYDQNKDRFTTQEERRGRHILITVGDGVDDAAAQKKAEELAAKAKAGADFAQLAKDNSKDAGSAAQGGALDMGPHEVWPGPFGDAMFSMNAGEIRVVKSESGWHVLQLEEIQAGHVKSFEEAHAELDSEYRKERAQNIFYE